VPKTEDAVAAEIAQLENEHAAAKAAAEAAAAAEQASRAAGKRGATSRDDDDSDGDEVALPSLVNNLAYFKDSKEDPYLKLHEEQDDDSEMADLTLEDTDIVLIGARSDEQFSTLEVNVYEEPAANLYTHHDVPLPVFPLCLAWMDCMPTVRLGGSEVTTANMVAIGTFAPFIEIWNLDVIDALEPQAVLGGKGALAAEEQASSAAAEAVAAQGRGGKKQGKRAKQKEAADAGHTDAVMALSWNAAQRNVLASGSADCTIRLWDLTGNHGESLLAMRHHADKVQAIEWCPAEPTLLLSAGFDRKAFVADVRAPDSARAWALSADAEDVAWDPHTSHNFAVSAEDGSVRYFDARSESGPVWQTRAHAKTTSSLSFNHVAKGVLATGSIDKTVKLWSVSGAQPKQITSHDAGVGKVFCVSFCADSPALLAVGGSKGKLAVWNTLEVEEMQQLLPECEAPLGDDGRVLGGATAGMGALDVNSSSDEEDGDGDGGDGGEVGGDGEEGAADVRGAMSSAGAAAGASQGIPRKKKKGVKVGGKVRSKKR